MDLSLKTFLIVCPLVFLAGVVDAIGGGGGLISLPAYILAGLDPKIASATNKMSACLGTFASTFRYVKNKCADLPLAVPGVIAALIGANIGAQLSNLVPDAAFKIALMVLLPVIAVFMLLKKDLKPDETKPPLKRTHQMLIVGAISLAIGTYDGFYGPGTGTFLILAYTALARMDALKAGGNTKLANLASNVSSLVVFLLSGRVMITLGLVAAVFSIAGHYIGAGIAIKNGSKFVRIVILGVIGLLMIKLIVEWI